MRGTLLELISVRSLCQNPALVIALVFTLLAAAPVEGRFVLEVAGLPLAELRVSANGDRYVY